MQESKPPRRMSLSSNFTRSLKRSLTSCGSVHQKNELTIVWPKLVSKLLDLRRANQQWGPTLEGRTRPPDKFKAGCEDVSSRDLHFAMKNRRSHDDLMAKEGFRPARLQILRRRSAAKPSMFGPPAVVLSRTRDSSERPGHCKTCGNQST